MFAEAYISWHEEARLQWPEFDPISQTYALAVVGAVNEPVCAMLEREGAKALPDLADELSAVVVAMLAAQPMSRPPQS